MAGTEAFHWPQMAERRPTDDILRRDGGGGAKTIITHALVAATCTRLGAKLKLRADESKNFCEVRRRRL